ncbi:MAG TPA: hypothetical protein VMT34_01030 [Aggregatilineales bacterium]|nr:hypothetical protein [Aggregatilineales bacterium]
MTSELDQLLEETDALAQEIDAIQGQQAALADEIQNTIKRLKVPWSRIPNAPVDDCVMLSRRLIKVYKAVQDLPEQQALDAIQKQISYRTQNMVVGGTKQTGEHPSVPPASQ